MSKQIMNNKIISLDMMIFRSLEKEKLEEFNDELKKNVKTNFKDRSTKGLDNSEIDTLNKVYKLDSNDVKNVFKKELYSEKKNIDRELNAEAYREYGNKRAELIKLSNKTIRYLKSIKKGDPDYKYCQGLVSAYDHFIILNKEEGSIKNIRTVQFILAASCMTCDCSKDLREYVNNLKNREDFGLDGYYGINTGRMKYTSDRDIAKNPSPSGKPSMANLKRIVENLGKDPLKKAIDEIPYVINLNEVIITSYKNIDIKTLNSETRIELGKTGLYGKINKSPISISNTANGTDSIELDINAINEETAQEIHGFKVYLKNGKIVMDKSITPDKPVVTPDKPVVTPDKPVVTPDKPVVTPDKPVVTPDKPVVTPDKPVVTPDKPVVTPDKPVVTPDKPVVTPDKPVVTPDKPVVTPDKPVVTPDKPVVTPDKPVVTPDKPVVTPDKPVVTPDKPVVTPDKPVVTPEINPNLPAGLKELKSDANGNIRGFDANKTYRIKTVKPGSEWKKLKDSEKTSAFPDGTQFALRKEPVKNEIFTVKREKQSESDNKRVSITPENTDSAVQLNGLPNNITSGAYQYEQDQRNEYFKDKFPIINISSYPKKEKEGAQIQKFVDENIKTIVYNNSLSLDDRIAKINEMLVALNDPKQNPNNRLPTGVHTNGKIVFDGDKLNSRRLWRERKNQNNEVNQFYNIMQVYKNQVIYHINKTNGDIYNHDLGDTVFTIEQDPALDAQRSSFTALETSESTTRSKLAEWYGQYSSNVGSLRVIVNNDKNAEKFLKENATSSNKKELLDYQNKRIEYMKQRIQVEGSLLLLSKKIGYLQGGAGDENNKPISNNEATTRIEKLKEDAQNLIKVYPEASKDLTSYINTASNEANKPSLLDIAHVFGVSLNNEPVPAIPNLAEASKTILAETQSIDTKKKELTILLNQQKQLQPGQPDYTVKYSTLQSSISSNQIEIDNRQKVIDQINAVYQTSINALGIVAKDFYGSLQTQDKNKQKMLLLPLTDATNPLLEKSNEIKTTYDTKQTTLMPTIDSNEVHNANKLKPKQLTEAMTAKQTELKTKIAESQGKITQALSDISTEQAKTAKGETPDLTVINENQKIIVEQNNSMQSNIVLYNTAFYQSAIAAQQEYAIDKTQIDLYHNETQENVNHLTENSTQLKTSIDNKIGQFNTIKKEVNIQLKNSLDEKSLGIKYNAPQIQNLVNQAKTLYKELTGTETGIDRDHFDVSQDISFEDIKKNAVEPSLIKTLEITDNLKTQETASLEKWKLYSDFQQIRIDIVGTKAQYDMIQSNIINREKYSKDVLQKQIDNNTKQVEDLTTQNGKLRSSLSSADINKKSEIYSEISANESLINDLNLRNTELGKQKITLAQRITDAIVRGVAMNTKLKNLQGNKLKLENSIKENNAEAFTSPANYTNQKGNSPYILKPDINVEYKPYQ